MSNVPQKYWGKKVTIQNNFTKEYLCADDKLYEWIFKRERRYVLTMRDKKPVPSKGDWILSPPNKENLHTLQNVHFSQFLYAAGSTWYKNNEYLGLKSILKIFPCNT